MAVGFLSARTNGGTGARLHSAQLVGRTHGGTGARQGSNLPPVPNPVALFLAHSMEPIVRPAVPDKSYRLLDRFVARRPKSGELPEASALWGQAADFDVQELKAPEKPTSPGISVIDSDDDGVPDEDPGPVTITYTEVSRKTHTKRVTNPDDSEQFVDVEVIDEWTAQRDDGVQVVLVFNNP